MGEPWKFRKFRDRRISILQYRASHTFLPSTSGCAVSRFKVYCLNWSSFGLLRAETWRTPSIRWRSCSVFRRVPRLASACKNPVAFRQPCLTSVAVLRDVWVMVLLVGWLRTIGRYSSWGRDRRIWYYFSAQYHKMGALKSRRWWVEAILQAYFSPFASWWIISPWTARVVLVLLWQKQRQINRKLPYFAAWAYNQKSLNLQKDMRDTFQRLYFRPEKFEDYLLSPDVGFTHCQKIEPQDDTLVQGKLYSRISN